MNAIHSGHTPFIDGYSRFDGSVKPGQYQKMIEFVIGRSHPDSVTSTGNIIALSGVSGIMQLAKWWLPAHVHLTVWFSGLPLDPFGEAANMDDKGFWIVRNAPRAPRAGDGAFDYPFPWQWLPTSVVLKQAAEKYPILWGNFAIYAHRMLPRYLSFDFGRHSLPRFTLPFHG